MTTKNEDIEIAITLRGKEAKKYLKQKLVEDGIRAGLDAIKITPNIDAKKLISSISKKIVGQVVTLLEEAEKK